MKNLAFHSLLRLIMILLEILTTSLMHFLFKSWENVFLNLGVKGLKDWAAVWLTYWPETITFSPSYQTFFHWKRYFRCGIPCCCSTRPSRCSLASPFLSSSWSSFCRLASTSASCYFLICRVRSAGLLLVFGFLASKVQDFQLRRNRTFCPAVTITM